MTSVSAATVTLELPSVLRAVAGWRRIELRGRTIGDVLEGAFERTPILRHHMMLDSTTLRPHVLCVLNDSTIPRDQVHSTSLTDGDEILIHQAISGG